MKKNLFSLILVMISSGVGFLFAQLPNAALQTLGHPINTLEYSEFAPTISADGNTLIFESDRSGRWRLYMSRQIKGVWTNPEDITAINNAVGPGDFIGGPCLSYDGKTLYFSSNMKGGIGGIDIWYSTKTGDKWGPPKNLGMPVNSSGYDGFPSISPDGRYIYFMREGKKNGPSGQRCCVIYRAERRGAFFINPQPLPFPVNTGCEAYPRIMADGKTLIFSSFRNEGKGGYDLYESKFNNGKWSKPVPLDFINTPKDDELISVPASGDVIYLSSTMSNNKDDIYKIELPKEFRPDKVISLEGTIKDEYNRAIPASIQITNIKSKEKIIEANNDSLTGNYQIFLEEGKKYDFSITAKGHTFHSEVLHLDTLKKYEQANKTVKLKKLKANTSFILNNIFFEFDSSSLSQNSVFELDRAIALMKANPKMVVEISAHTDDKGSDAYNDALSQARSESVVKYLAENGISRERMIAKGYGKRTPCAPNDTEENRAKNRRVEFKVIKI